MTAASIDAAAPARAGLMETAKALARGGLRRLPAPWYWRFVAWRVGHFDAELQLLPFLCDATKASIDVGASIGSYTVHLLNHSASCYAFEPRLDAVASLVRRLTARPSPRLHVEAVALSDRTGEAALRIVRTDAGRSTIEAANPVERVGAIEVVTVPTRRLDDYAAVIGAVGCIKIDVEGHEESVLRGAERILVRDRPALIVEIEERHKRASVGAVARYLGGLSYRGFFFRGGRLRPIESFRAEGHQDTGKISAGANGESAYVNNFLFLGPHTRARLRHLIDDR